MIKVNGLLTMLQEIKNLIKSIEEQLKVSYTLDKQSPKINHNLLKLKKKIKSKFLLIGLSEVQIWLKNSSIRNKWSSKAVNSTNLLQIRL
jgi:hypothetical protein